MTYFAEKPFCIWLTRVYDKRMAREKAAKIDREMAKLAEVAGRGGFSGADNSLR